MAAAKARGGGVVGGGDAVKRVPGFRFRRGARASFLRARTRPRRLVPRRRFRGGGAGCLGAFSRARLPAPSRLSRRARGRPRRVRLEDAPGFKTGDVALRAKLLTMRLDPELAGAHPPAAEARGAVCETLKLLDDKETKREILTNATRRRVDEMRAKNIGDVRGGYVSATGVHYAAGAAAAAVSDYKADDAGGRSGDEPGGEDTRRRGGGGEGF